MKIRSLFVVVIVSAFFSFSFAFQVKAQNPFRNRSTITGYVFDEHRSPISQIPVELMNDVNSVIQRTRTDGSGRYFFSGLSGGRFTIKVLPLGTNFEEQTQEVELVTFGGMGRDTPEFAQKDFYLKERRANSGLPSVTGTIFAQDVPVDAQKTFEKAVSDLDNEKVEEGIAGLESALKMFPNYYMALERLGSIYISQQKYENARDIFSRAVVVNERGFNSWYGLGYANYYLNKSKEAVDAAQKAVSLNGNSVDAQMFLGISLRLNKQYEDSEKALLLAKKLSKGQISDVHWYLALLYAHNLKRYDKAASELELYLKVFPDAPNKEVIKKLIKQFRENPPSE